MSDNIGNAELIKQRIREEYAKCSTDFIYFFKKYLIIAHPVKGKISFNLYPFQERTLEELHKNKYTVINKGRQLGISTLVAGYALWKMTFKSDYKILVLATTQPTAIALVDKVTLMHTKLPSWLKEATKTENKQKLEYKNGSSIVAVSSSEKSARSPSLSLLIVDEAAFIDDFEDIWIASQATLATGGDCVILSSPNGMGNTFHKICVEAQEGTHDTSAHAFKYIELPWHLHPERDAKWAEEQRIKLGKRGFAQEHECDFLGSGHTLIEGDILKWYLDNVCKEPVEKRYPNSDYWIWKYPDYNRSYVLIADVGRGDGNDYSTFHVLDVESVEQVASFRSKIDTREFGNLLVSVGTDYNNALLVIDNKGIGWDVVQVAIDRGYPNLYYSYRNDPFLDDNIQLKKMHDLKDKSDMVPGFTTATKNRLVIISKIETNVREKLVIINDKRTVNEMFTFMWINGKVQAQRGYNDDLLMALGIGYFVRDTALRLRQHGIDLTKRSLAATHRTVYKPSTINKDAFKLKTGRGGEEDISWLVR